MSERIQAPEVVNLLTEHDNILIVSHKNPDGDTLGSGFALMHTLRAMGKTVSLFCADAVHPRYEYMRPEIFADEFEPQFVVTVDVAGVQLLGEEAAKYTGHVDLAIDHHPSNTGFADRLWLDEHAAATAQMIYELVELTGVEFTPLIANCIYTGIATDTGCFRFANTNIDTHMCAAHCIEKGAETARLNQLLFESKSKRRIEIERKALASLKYYYDERVAVICITREQIESMNIEETDLEGITAIPRMIEGVDIGITMRQLPEGSYKVSIRSTDVVDASEIAKRLGGGGHKRAAGCEVIGSEENVLAALLREANRALFEMDAQEEEQ